MENHDLRGEDIEVAKPKKRGIAEDFEDMMALPAGRRMLADILVNLGYNKPLYVRGDTEQTAHNLAGYENAIALSKRLNEYSSHLFQLLKQENQL